MQGYSGDIFEENTYLGHSDLTVPLFINCCGYLKSTGLDVSLKRTRSDFYIIYLINGIGHYKFSDEIISIDAGNIILYKPDQYMDYYYLGYEKTELYWIHFTGFYAEEMLKDLELYDKSYHSVGVDTNCISLFENIIHEIQIKKPHFHKLCTGYLLQLLSTFSRKASFPNQTKSIIDSDIEDIITCMNHEYNQEHSISYYAKKCNLSVYQFTRNFKRFTQLPPAKYIEKIRVAKAKELLSDTSLTISEISNLIGYNDPFYFSKVFKRATNCTPSSFRGKNSP